MKYVITLIIALSAVLLFSCGRETPVHLDGTLSYQMSVYYTDTTGTDSPSIIPVQNAEVTLTAVSYSGADGNPLTYTRFTDSSGLAVFDQLTVGRYNVFVSKEIKTNAKTILITGSKTLVLPDSIHGVDSLRATPIEKSNLVINEIYFCGPVNRNYYFYDQFIELYNNSDMTVYLDGMYLCRVVQTHPTDLHERDYVQTLNLFRFPGEALTGREYPVAPGQFVVIAQDAVDHSQYIETAVDLSGADWEFYNPYAGDIDFPAPNVENFLPEKTNDFMINLTHNAVILSDGSDWYWGEINENDYQYIHIPISTIIDGVEYSSNPEKQKELNRRVDAGFAGVNIPKYSGMSTQRREPGFDTNNSSIDFVNLDHPTPGYQNE